MTEQEAQALAERLTRVWGVNCTVQEAWKSTATASFPPSTCLTVIQHPMGLIVRLEDKFSHLFCEPTGKISSPRFSKFNHQWRNEQQRRFTNTWLPMFRRGCWLSGCPIEATAHEKVEWMQGFTKEELEAWNLKM